MLQTTRWRCPFVLQVDGRTVKVGMLKMEAGKLQINILRYEECLESIVRLVMVAILNDGYLKKITNLISYQRCIIHAFSFFPKFRNRCPRPSLVCKRPSSFTIINYASDTL